MIGCNWLGLRIAQAYTCFAQWPRADPVRDVLHSVEAAQNAVELPRTACADQAFETLNRASSRPGGPIAQERQRLDISTFIQQTQHPLSWIAVIAAHHLVGPLTIQRDSDAVLLCQLENAILRIDAGAAEGLALSVDETLQIMGKLLWCYVYFVRYCANMLIDQVHPVFFRYGAFAGDETERMDRQIGFDLPHAHTMTDESIPPDNAAPKGTSLRR